MHIREAIRTEAAAAITGLTTTGARVYVGRAYAIDELELPCWVVTWSEESAELEGMGGLYGRTLRLELWGFAREPSGQILEATLDLMAEELETALGAHSWTNARDATLTGTTFEMAPVEQTDQVIGGLQVTYDVDYDSLGAPSA